jgi:hypothetical protein
LVPPVVLTSLYKGLLMLKLGKKWKEKWEVTSAAARWVSQGTRRRNEQPH